MSVIGKFMEMLKRGNDQIKSDRAETIGESAKLKYKRKVEDIEVELKELTMEQENLLDQSPEDADSLKLASDFDAEGFVNNDINLGVKIRNKTIRLEIAQARYKSLFE